MTKEFKELRSLLWEEYKLFSPSIQSEFYKSYETAFETFYPWDNPDSDIPSQLASAFKIVNIEFLLFSIPALIQLSRVSEYNKTEIVNIIDLRWSEIENYLNDYLFCLFQKVLKAEKLCKRSM